MIDFGRIAIPGESGASQMDVGSSGPSSGPSSGSMPEDPATLRQMLLSSPHDISILKERNPPLADALLSGDLGMTSSLHPSR